MKIRPTKFWLFHAYRQRDGGSFNRRFGEIGIYLKYEMKKKVKRRAYYLYKFSVVPLHSLKQFQFQCACPKLHKSLKILVLYVT
jgi:hypothetical protein